MTETPRRYISAILVTLRHGPRDCHHCGTTHHKGEEMHSALIFDGVRATPVHFCSKVCIEAWATKPAELPAAVN